MASPPFNILQDSPEDDDIASQFPLNERQFRDIVESWLLINHNNLGQHKYIQMPFTAPGDVPAGVADITTIYVDQYGEPHMLRGTVDEYLSVPPGTIIWTAIPSTTAPAALNGYLHPNGSAVSRTSFARLFTLTGTTYGAGDGSTTFNLPKLMGRTIFAPNTLAGVTDNQLGFSGDSLQGAVGQRGGSDRSTLITQNLPPYTPTGVISGNVSSSGFNSLAVSASGTMTGNASVPFFLGATANAGGDFGVVRDAGSTNIPLTVTGSVTGTATGTVSVVGSSNTLSWSGFGQGGLSAAFSNLPPGIVLVPLLKY